MKHNVKFKVGDRVKILPLATSVSVESEEVGKVGEISSISRNVTRSFGIWVQMKEVCKARGYIPKWSVGTDMIELFFVKNEQLLFEFMDK